jgi:hypothetical protein
MSGSRRNALLPPANDYDPMDANFGRAYPLPRFVPPDTYTGAIPTPPSNTAEQLMELPAEYYHLLQNQGVGGPPNPLLNQLLQTLYLRRRQRT